MPDWLTVIILGVIEGITEFLPVSSTGHLLIPQNWGWLAHQSDLFNIVIQSAAVLAVIPLFRDRMQQVLRAHRDPEARDFTLKVLTSFCITGVGGVLLEAGGFELEEEVLPVALALVVGGVLFLVVERWLTGRTFDDSLTWKVVVAVGLGQLVAAVFPGASRSGTTILIMLIMGLSRPAATEFSFVVGIPTMLAAGGLKLAKALFRPEAGAPTEDWGLLLLGAVVSAVVSFIAVKWLLGFVRSHTFVGFGWYRIGLGSVLLVMLLA
jgi:undecaprenyl-diphosphatase